MLAQMAIEFPDVERRIEVRASVGHLRKANILQQLFAINRSVLSHADVGR